MLSFGNSYEFRSPCLDISKAFDKIWHQGRIFKLQQNGINDNLLKLFKNYLADMKKRVVLNGCNSMFFTIETEVHQGSVLWPLLFLIYINDLDKGIKSNIKFFVDYTMIYSKVSDVNLTAFLDHDQWKMLFNPEINK